MGRQLRTTQLPHLLVMFTVLPVVLLAMRGSESPVVRGEEGDSLLREVLDGDGAAVHQPCETVQGEVSRGLGGLPVRSLVLGVLAMTVVVKSCVQDVGDGPKLGEVEDTVVGG